MGMGMTTFSIQLPESSHVSEFDAKIILAGELYERGKLSLGQAAEVAGLSKRAFIEIMGKYGFSIFSDSMEDFEKDLKNAWKA
jgi:predicted HTH domain antitoxin